MVEKKYPTRRFGQSDALPNISPTTKLQLEVDGPINTTGREPYWQIACSVDKSIKFSIPMNCPAETRLVVDRNAALVKHGAGVPLTLDG